MKTFFCVSVAHLLLKYVTLRSLDQLSAIDPAGLHHVYYTPIILYSSISLYLHLYFCSQMHIPCSKGIHTRHLRYHQTETISTESSVSSLAKHNVSAASGSVSRYSPISAGATTAQLFAYIRTLTGWLFLSQEIPTLCVCVHSCAVCVGML